MGARGNSGVILSQIVRGAAEELASRPGELVDPVLVAAAFARAADAAYESVRDPAEGTMLTVIREMAHAASQHLAHMDRQRLSSQAGDDEQDELLAEVLAVAASRARRRSSEPPSSSTCSPRRAWWTRRARAGGDPGGDRRRAARRGRRGPGGPASRAAEATRPHHFDSRYRYCTNFIVTGQGLESRSFVQSLEEIGDSVLVVGDQATLKVHVHTDEPEVAVAVFEQAGDVQRLDVADMREQIEARERRLTPALTGVVAVAAGDGMKTLFEALGAHVVDGGATLNPSTYEILAGIHEVHAEEVLVLPNSPNVILAAQEAAKLSEKHARVVPSLSQQAALAALVELDPERRGRQRGAAGVRAGGDQVGRGRARRADDPKGRFVRGDAVGFAGEEVVAWGGAGSTLSATVERLVEGSRWSP